MPRTPKRLCVMRGFCPLCLRNGEPDYRPEAHTEVDQEQAECSKKLQGLPLLCFAAHGRPCESPCRITCAVCGHAAMFGCEPEFQDVLDALDDHESACLEARTEVLEGFNCLEMLGARMMADLERRLRRKLATWKLGWHSRWQRITHLHCIKRARCGCTLAACTTLCNVHGEQRVLKRASRAAPMDIEGMDSSYAPEMQLATRPTPGPATTTKATWLARPTELARATTRTTEIAPVKPIAKRLKPEPPKKANLRLQQASLGCKRLDAWSGLATQDAPPPLSTQFSKIKHFRDFDPFQHGYWKVNGRDVYRFPDGRQVFVSTGVNKLTEDGQLEPS